MHDGSQFPHCTAFRLPTRRVAFFWRIGRNNFGNMLSLVPKWLTCTSAENTSSFHRVQHATNKLRNQTEKMANKTVSQCKAK